MLYTIKQFIKYGVHLGHYKWENDYRLSYFLLGIRNSIHILNLYYTLFILKQGLYITYNISLLNQKLLVMNYSGYKLESIFENINKILNQKQLWYIGNKWIGGLLSNQKIMFFFNEKLFLNLYGIGCSSLLPSYVFALNSKNSCIFEAIVLDIPCSTFIDSNLSYYGIFYGFPGNDDNYTSGFMFSRLFIKMCLKGIYDNINILNTNKYVQLILKWKTIKNIWGKKLVYRKNILKKVSKFVRYVQGKKRLKKYLKEKKKKNGKNWRKDLNINIEKKMIRNLLKIRYKRRKLN